MLVTGGNSNQGKICQIYQRMDYRNLLTFIIICLNHSSWLVTCLNPISWSWLVELTNWPNMTFQVRSQWLVTFLMSNMMSTVGNTGLWPAILYLLFVLVFVDNFDKFDKGSFTFWHFVLLLFFFQILNHDHKND